MTIPDPDHPEDEERFILIGMSVNRRGLVVVHVECAEDEYQLISARLATRHERLTLNSGNLVTRAEVLAQMTDTRIRSSGGPVCSTGQSRRRGLPLRSRLEQSSGLRKLASLASYWTACSSTWAMI